MSDAVSDGQDGAGAAGDGDPADDSVVAASDAFAALGSETRMGIVRSLFEAERDAGRPVTRPFSALFETSDEETTAGFAYHLRQLPDTYLRKVEAAEAAVEGDGDGDAEAGYRLTAAGRRVARAIAAGTLTESADRAPVALDAPCPFCAEPSLRAAGDDTILTVTCGACEREVLGLPFPPAGYRAHDDGALPDAVNSYYRGRIATMRDGTCPECGGVVETAAELAGNAGGADDEASVGDRAEGGAATGDGRGADARDAPPTARARMTCTACGYRLRCPVTLTVLDEPAVVAAFHAAGVDISERPLWNVGPEWSERVVSTDPLAVRVTARVGDGELACFVGRDLSVVHTDWATPDDGDGSPDAAAVADDVASEEASVADGSESGGETESGAETPAVGDPDSATA